MIIPTKFFAGFVFTTVLCTIVAKYDFKTSSIKII